MKTAIYTHRKFTSCIYYTYYTYNCTLVALQQLSKNNEREIQLCLHAKISLTEISGRCR